MTVLRVRVKILETAVTKMTYAFKGYNNHKGIDVIPSSTNETPEVLAYDEGIVIATGNVSGTNKSTGTAGMGTFVAIKHPNGLVTRYEHLKYNSLKVRKGDRVWKNRVLGLYGRPTTGYSSGPHLHWDLSSPILLGGDYIKGAFCNETRYYYDPQPYIELKTGTVTGDVNIRTGPGTNNKVVGELKKGEKITIYGRSGSWVRIEPASPRWISSSYIVK